MSALLKSLFGGLASFWSSDNTGKVLDTVLEKTEDVDKRNALVMQYLGMREETRRAELARVTVPWVDAAHKMGRQILILSMVLGVLGCVALGRVEDLLKVYDLVLTALGVGGGYVALKGRGR